MRSRFEETMVKDFPKLMASINAQISEVWKPQNE
jgi:hypothetical protein